MSLGKMLLNLGLNSGTFDTDVGRTARLSDKRFKQIKKSADVAMKAVVTGFTAAASASLLMVKNTANLGDKLDKTSKRLGVSVEFLSKYDHQASLTGTSLASVDKGVTKLQKSINDSINGLSTATRGFDTLGLSAKELSSLNPEEAFELVSDSLGKLEKQSELTGTAMDLLGRSGTDLINLFKQTPEQVAKANEELERFGAVMSTAQAEQGAAFNDSLQSLKKNAEGFGNVLSSQLTPALTEIINQFNDSTIRSTATEDFTILQNAIVGVFSVALHLKAGFESIGTALGQIAAKSVDSFKLLATGFETFIKRIHRGSAIIASGFSDEADATQRRLGLEIQQLEQDFINLYDKISKSPDTTVFEDIDKIFGDVKKRVDSLSVSIKKGNKDLSNSKKPAAIAKKALEDIGNGIKYTESQLSKLSKDFNSIADRFLTPLEKLEKQYHAEIVAVDAWLSAQEDWDKAVVIAANLTNQLTEELDGNVKALEELGEATEAVDFSGMFDDFATGLNPAIGALQSFKDELVLISELDLTQGQKAFYSTGVAAEFALNSMASMAEDGSKAQKKLQAAAAITNTILGISAILEQGKGDPYTAFARMAAMAAMVASMGVQIAGAFGGSGGGGAERQQATQGTGTVLGDASAQSESIGNALDLIADASEKIVSINSKMLRSLNTMNNAISGTVNQIAQTGEIGNLGTTAGNAGGVLGGVLGGLFSSIGSFLFGSSKITDRGVGILAGGISEAIDGTLFQAYEVARRSGIFGSSTATNTAGLGNEITNQIGLIFESMTDAVLSGADALGVDLTEVQAALDAYQIEAQQISLLDLDPEEQRAALSAVFSSIFDGLVNVSIPFITQFQQAGEGLGETLARVSTTVLVFEEAIGSMGLDFIAKQVDPELFAQAAVAISDFAGGLDAFIDGYTNYVNNFLSDDEQFDILSNRLEGVFSDLDFKLPGTREGFTDLIQGLDLTTAAGQEAFGILIALSSQMDAFYTGIEDSAQEALEAQERLTSFMSGISSDLENMGLSDFALKMKDIRLALEQNIATAIELGATEKELAMIRNFANRQFRNVIRDYEQIAQELSNSIFGSASENLISGIESQLSSVGEQISLLEQQQSAAQQAAQASIQAYEAQQAALENIADFAESLLTGQFSPLNPAEQLAIAQSQFDSALASGDLEALPGLAQTLLELSQTNFASGQQNTDIFNQVYEALSGLGIGIGQGGPSASSGVPPGLQNLYEQQALLNQQLTDAQIASDTAATLLQQQQLFDMLLELATAQNISIQDLAERLGIPLDQLVEDLNINLNNLRDSITPLGADPSVINPPELNNENTIVADAITTEGGETQDILLELLNETRDQNAEIRNLVAQLAAS